jgi:hypothetical protein
MADTAAASGLMPGKTTRSIAQGKLVQRLMLLGVPQTRLLTMNIITTQKVELLQIEKLSTFLLRFPLSNVTPSAATSSFHL